MSTYTYKARNEAGKPVRGTMEGISKEDIAEKLHKMGYMPTRIAEAHPGVNLEQIGAGFKGIKTEDIIVFNIQLCNMIDSGLSLLTSLNTISRQIENKKLKEVIGEIARSVEAGASFSDALAKHPRIFAKLFVNMVRAGEASGKLNTVLKRYAVYMEQQQELAQKIKSAFFYPVILLFAGILVIIFIVSFVMPQFVEIFSRVGVALPIPTRILYTFGLILKKYWYILILGVAFLISGFKFYTKSEIGRLKIDKLKLKFPILGPLVRKLVISRFSRTLATLLNSDVPVLESLDIVKGVVGNEVIGRVIKNVRDSVEEGERFAQSLKISEEFPQDTIQMIAAGEETGRLGDMLNKIADFYDSQVGYTVKKLTTLIEPIFLVIMGCMVGFIMISMLLPIFDMMKTLRH